MAKAATWPSVMAPEVRPSTMKRISSAGEPCRRRACWAMTSWGSISSPWPAGGASVPSRAARSAVRTPEAPMRKCGRRGPARAHDAVAEGEVDAGVGRGPDAAGGLQADVAAAGADRGEQDLGGLGGGVDRDLAGRGLEEVGAPGQRLVGGAADQGGVLQLAGLEDGLEGRGAADVLDLADRRGDRLGVAGGEAAPGHHEVDLVGAVGERARGSRRGRLSAAPRRSGKLTTVATRMPGAGELAAGLVDEVAARCRRRRPGRAGCAPGGRGR